MAKRKIIWTQTAARQRKNILEYWVDHNKSNSYSLKLLKASNSKTEQADFPDTRVVSMGHFSIFYKFNYKEIIITAFWDNRQNPSKLLEELKTAK